MSTRHAPETEHRSTRRTSAALLGTVTLVAAMTVAASPAAADDEPDAHLMLVNKVINGSTGQAESGDWQLTATSAGGPPVIDQRGMTNDTGPVAGVDAETPYTLTVSPVAPASGDTDGYVSGDWSCTNADSQSSFTLADGAVTLDTGADVTCTVTQTWQPTARVDKTVDNTRQNPDGSWTTTYDVTVTNPDTGLPATYSLADAPDFGDGITIVGGTVTGPDGSAGPAWNGSDAVDLATDRTVTAGASETWTVAIDATVTPQADETDRQCSGDGAAGSGFFNSATITSGTGGNGSAACAAPTVPRVSKEWVSTVPDADGTWTVTYTVTVSNPTDPAVNPSAPAYSLSDAVAFPADIAVQSMSADLDGRPVGVWDSGSSALTDLAVDRSLAAGDSDVYRVSVVASATAPITDTAELACSPGTPGRGFYGRATLVSHGGTVSAEACADIPESALAPSSDSAPSTTADSGSVTDTATDTATGTATDTATGTATGTGTMAAEPTASPDDRSSASPDGASSGTAEASAAAMPDTGIDTWGMGLLALVLLVGGVSILAVGAWRGQVYRGRESRRH